MPKPLIHHPVINLLYKIGFKKLNHTSNDFILTWKKNEYDFRISGNNMYYLKNETTPLLYSPDMDKAIKILNHTFKNKIRENKIEDLLKNE